MLSPAELTEKIISKATSLGATVAGVASVDTLKQSPSHRIYPIIGLDLDKRWPEVGNDARNESVAWPEDAKSAVVIGVEHNPAEPELDWWDGKGTPGNRILIRIAKELSVWIENSFTVRTHKPPYMIEKGGLFLKDAAVLAGLGCIGRNNLVVTPDYGPRIRFRALLLGCEAEPTGPRDFNPCIDCKQPCRRVCPIKAFEQKVFSSKALNLSKLPGTEGTYDRVTCNVKMNQDIVNAIDAVPSGQKEKHEARLAIDGFEDGFRNKSQKAVVDYCVKYCRRCELVCPVGK